MRKIIFGIGLMICGTIAFSAEYLREAMFFASSKNIVYGDGFSIMRHGGIILILAGLVLCFISLLMPND